MAKMRSKNLKPKLQPDFKKKKAKVGRKVERGNITTINVKSKHIVIPVQAQMQAKKAGSEQELVDKILKQLSHHNLTARTSSIEELRQFLESSPNAATFVPSVFPVALELLFDEEKATRKAFLQLSSFIFAKFPSQLFVSFVPVIVTYLCGGLTSLLKGVRRDALLFLIELSSSHNFILAGHLEKILANTVGLLKDFSVTSGADAMSNSAIATHSVLKRFSQGDKSQPKLQAQPVTINTPLLVLRALHALLEDGGGSAGSNSANKSVLPHMRRMQSPAATMAGNTSMDTASDTVVSLWEQLLALWTGWCANSSSLTISVVSALQEIVNVAKSLTSSSSATHQNLNVSEQYRLVSLQAAMLSAFPYTCSEVSSLQSADAERAVNATFNAFNLSICDLILSTGGSSSGTGSGCHAATEYVLLQFRQFSEALERQGIDSSSAGPTTTSMDIINDSDSSDSESDGDDEGDADDTENMDVTTSEAKSPATSVPRGSSSGSGSTNGSTSLFTNDTVKRIFSCVCRIIRQLSAGSPFPASSSSSSSSSSTVTSSSPSATIGTIVRSLNDVSSCLLFKATTTRELETVNAVATEWMMQMLELVVATMETLGDSVTSTAIFAVLNGVIIHGLCSVFSNVVKVLRVSSSSLTTTLQSSKSYESLLSRSCGAYLSVLRTLPVELNECVMVNAPTMKVHELVDLSQLIQCQKILVLLFEDEDTFQSHFSTAGLGLQFKLLDIYYYTALDTVECVGIHEVLIRHICTESISGQVQAQFLRLLFERRRCMNAGDFLSLVTQALTTWISSVCKDDSKAGSKGKGKGAKKDMQDTKVARLRASMRVMCNSLRNDWLAHAVGHSLLSASASDNPSKMLQTVHDILSDIFGQYSTKPVTSSNNSTKTATTVIKELSTVPNKLFVSNSQSFAAWNAGAVIVSILLGQFGSSWEDVNVRQAAEQLVCLVVDKLVDLALENIVFLKILVDYLTTTKSGGLFHSDHESSNVCCCIGGGEDNDGKKVIDPFLWFKELILLFGDDNNFVISTLYSSVTKSIDGLKQQQPELREKLSCLALLLRLVLSDSRMQQAHWSCEKQLKGVLQLMTSQSHDNSKGSDGAPMMPEQHSLVAHLQFIQLLVNA